MPLRRGGRGASRMKTIDIKTFSSQLQESLKGQLETIGLENPDVITKTSKCLGSVRSVINQLKDFVCRYEFKSKEEEIRFFREIKPLFISQYYYYEKVLSIRMDVPFSGSDSLKAYYFTELDSLHQFVKVNREFYKYCLSNATYFDEKYFTRSEYSSNDPGMDTRFSTGYDNRLGKIIAWQMVKEFLDDLIQKTDSQSQGLQSPLNWTGTKSALIELIYALQSVDAVNHGKADIKQIAGSFETLFNVSLGNYYRQFQEIRLRKGGKTNFLDDMREKLAQRLDDFS